MKRRNLGNCSVAECDRASFARELCSLHYQRTRRPDNLSKVCEYCNGQFTAKNSLELYCSKLHRRRAAYRRRQDKKILNGVITFESRICPRCHNSFDVRLGYKGRKIYCSNTCTTKSAQDRVKVRRKPRLSICITCGGFYRNGGRNREVCSKSCTPKSKIKIRVLRQRRREVDELRDGYLRKQIWKQTGLPTRFVTSELISMKRQEYQAKRLLRSIKEIEL